MRSISIAILCLFSQVLSAQAWLWSHQIGGPSSESIRLIGTDALAAIYIYGGYSGASGVYIGQDTLYAPYGAAFIAKYNSDGTLAWVRNCTSPNGIGINGAVIDTVANTLYVAGVYINSCILDTCALSSLYSGGFISQWDLDGHCLWARNAVTSGPDLANHFCTTTAVTVDLQGHVFVGGYTTPYGPNYLAGRLVPEGTYMAAYTATGDTIWTRMLALYQDASTNFQPLAMGERNGALFAYGRVYLNSESDTLVVDTVAVTGFHGSGHALFRMDPVNGDMDWLRVDGYPHSGASLFTPQQLYLDNSGNSYVACGYGDMAIFGTDTILSSYAGGFLAEYDPDGMLQWVRNFVATGSAGFASLCSSFDGGLKVVGYVNGAATWDGISFSTNSMHMLVASFSSIGQCLGVESEVGPATGRSITQAQDGYYVTGQFPPSSSSGPPYRPITIGSEIYNTFGGQDAFLAKHSLNVGVGIPSYRSVEADGLHIYANPNRGSFQVQLPDAFANSRNLVLHVYDSTGRMVLEQQLDMGGEPAHMDVFDAVPGLYNVTVTDGHSTCSGSMVVE